MKRILVVDDEHCIADTLTAILRNFGYDATARYDAQSALEECDSRAPDLVISDVIMPGLNGIDMAIRIRQKFTDCKILLFSGVAGSFDLLAETRLTGHDFELLTKPVQPAELLRKVESELRTDPLPQSEERPARSPGLSVVPSKTSGNVQEGADRGRARREA